MKNLVLSENGDLYQNEPWKVIREKYHYHFTEFEGNRHKLRATIRAGAISFPGGYPLYLLFGDGDACCFECASAGYKCVAKDMKEGCGASFQLVGCKINYEDNDLHCGLCNKQIESAYCNDENEDD
jgi:hypothetical protein